MTRRAAVIVTSTRAATGVYTDRTGPMIVDWLLAHDFETDEPIIVADGPAVAPALRSALAAGVDLLVTTGGTGIAAGDGTADATAALVEKTLPGFHEELRRRGALVSRHALLSRGVAGVAGNTFIVNLPGSTGGVRDGLDLLAELVDHVLDQLAGGTHD